MAKASTEELNHVLEETDPSGIEDYLKNNSEDLITSSHPFSDYMRTLLKQKGISQQELFERAELPERYGYRLLTQEKNTRQRDYILRFCFGANLTLKEAQQALRLYRMSELYSKIPRDAVIIIAFNRGIYKIEEVNELLIKHGMDPLKSSASME